MWALLKPNKPTDSFSKIILCSFYSPPNSKKNKQLLEHIAMTYNTLKLQHPNAAFILSGDKNNLDETKILALNPDIRQIVSRNTRLDKILTILITDLHKFYRAPQVIPPVPVDTEGLGIPSDHSGIFAMPISSSEMQRGTEVVRKVIRPMPDSLLLKFGSSLAAEFALA